MHVKVVYINTNGTLRDIGRLNNNSEP